MTWDGKPEHRGMRDDGQPKTTEDYRREIAERAAELPQPHPRTAAEYFRDQAGRLTRDRREPEPDPMPPDPFGGMTAPLVAQVEMIRAAIDAGLTEPQALYYVACLVQVGNAMREGGMLGQMPQWPPEAP